jgi:hypothetical protein
VRERCDAPAEDESGSRENTHVVGDVERHDPDCHQRDDRADRQERTPDDLVATDAPSVALLERVLRRSVGQQGEDHHAGDERQAAAGSEDRLEAERPEDEQGQGVQAEDDAVQEEVPHHRVIGDDALVGGAGGALVSAVEAHSSHLLTFRWGM